MADNADLNKEKAHETPKKEKKQNGDGKACGCSGPRDSKCQCLPPPELTSFMMSLVSAALMQLGEIPDPVDGGVVFDLTMAKHSIDIIAMLQDKFRNGLTEEEDRLIEGFLYELRLRYVQKS